MSRRVLNIVGGRGYAGGEFLALLARHGGLRLGAAVSRSEAGQPIAATTPAWPDPGARFVTFGPEEVSEHPADAWVLALPNGAAGPWVEAIDAAAPHSVVIDFSADYRFDSGWVYGLPERHRAALEAAKRIANPGCYATGAQLAIAPVLDDLAGAPVVFGVSGYSGAGRTPSPKNDPERLRDNLMPYALTGHMHEKEVSAQLGRDVRFHPHVAAFFRGISLTVSMELTQPTDAGSLYERFRAFYAGERGVRVDEAIPEVRLVAGTPMTRVGGFAVDARDARRVTVVAVLDNLLKGAASQAMQNLNLALGFDEWTGLDHG